MKKPPKAPESKIAIELAGLCPPSGWPRLAASAASTCARRYRGAT